MADPVIGSAAPAVFPLPDWLTKVWETSKTSEVHLLVKLAPNAAPPATYDRIELHDFTFLGQTFEEAQYVGFDKPPDPANPNLVRKQVDGPHKGTGVCLELKELLVQAQHNIFQLYAQRQAARGKEATEQGFKDFCLIGGLHKGFQPRDGKHKRGAALDIDPTFNPYVPTGDLSNPLTLGGETPRSLVGSAGSAVNRAKLQQIRSDALTAYANAVRFTFGTTEQVNVKNRAPGEQPKKVFQRFNIVHRALTLYFGCGFDAFATKNKKGVFVRANSIPKDKTVLPVDVDTLATRINNNRGFFQGGDAPSRTGDAAFLQQLQQQLVKDYAAMRSAAIYGSWDIVNGIQTGFSSTRDPTYGIMFLTEQVVVPLITPNIMPGRSLRWGAVDFNTQSGDIMHFDLGPAADNIAIKRTIPNTANACY
jgi:hypothetical protein